MTFDLYWKIKVISWIACVVLLVLLWVIGLIRDRIAEKKRKDAWYKERYGLESAISEQKEQVGRTLEETVAKVLKELNKHG